MMLDPATFLIHDISRFPILTVRNESIQPGYATQWEKEMNALLAHDHPFAVVYVETPDIEARDDLKQRGLWLKEHKSELERVCKVLISVEPDGERRELARIRGEGAAKAFGIPHRAVASLDEAFNLASMRVVPPSATRQ
jgi:hypothetical protein